MPPETPAAFGLHANAEVGFKRREAERFCAALQGLQPRQLGGEAGLSPEERAKQVLDDVAEHLPEAFDLEAIRGRVDERTPYAMVAIQARARPAGRTRRMRAGISPALQGISGRPGARRRRSA